MEQLTKIKSELKLKVNYKDFKLLLDRFNVFSEIETIEKLRENYLPKIASFAGRVEIYETQDQITRECIRKLDESLSIKVNKGAFLEFQQELENKFMRILDWESMKK